MVHRTDVARDGTVAGQILGQSPTAGTSLAEHKTLALVVSTGPPPVTVPTDLAGMPLVAATSALQAAELAVGPLTYQYDETHAKDVVLGLAGDPAGPAAQGLEGAAGGVQRTQAPGGAVDAGGRHRWPPPPPTCQAIGLQVGPDAQVEHDGGRRSGPRRPARRRAPRCREARRSP